MIDYNADDGEGEDEDYDDDDPEPDYEDILEQRATNFISEEQWAFERADTYGDTNVVMP